MDNAEIPLNKEVKYDTPTPFMPIEDMEPVEGIKDIEETEDDCEGQPYCS